jgi:hypothetical protein
MEIYDLKDRFTENVTFYVDILPSDFRLLKKFWVREFLDHEKCTLGGDLCTNLMKRDVAWEACNF